MWARVFIIASNICILALLGWVLIKSRRPLCIDSSIVQKIDISTQHGGETAWSCGLLRPVPFGPYLHEMLPYITDRVHRAEAVFKAVGRLEKPARIQISLQHPWVFEVTDHQILIGEQLFLSEGHLEKGLFKIWYRERSSELFVYSSLAEEVITDLMLYFSQQKLNIEDRTKGLTTRLEGARWPQVIKSLEAYCESPWKISEHFHHCNEGNDLDKYLSETLVSLSLRPLISSSLIDSYRLLKIQEKNQLISDLAKFVSSKREPPLSVIAAEGRNLTGLLEGRRVLKEIQEYLFRAQETRINSSFKVLISHFTENLRRRGFNEATSEVFFDFIYETQQPLQKDSTLFEQLKKISESDENLQIAVIDGKNIWFFPAADSIEVDLFTGIKSRNRIVERCGSFDFGYVYGFNDKTEKLMVIDTCKGKTPQSLEAYLKEGPEGFARNNKEISFVQFHMPSLQLKIESIPAKENVVSLVQNRDINSPVLQALGWQELNWEKNVQAYKPKAQVEAIQWFRF